MQSKYKKILVAFCLSLAIYTLIITVTKPKPYAVHVDGQTEYRRYEYDCDSVIGNYAYRDGVKLKLAGKTEHFFNEKK